MAGECGDKLSSCRIPQSRRRVHAGRNNLVPIGRETGGVYLASESAECGKLPSAPCVSDPHRPVVTRGENLFRVWGEDRTPHSIYFSQQTQ